jgi:hypothetical protein
MAFCTLPHVTLPRTLQKDAHPPSETGEPYINSSLQEYWAKLPTPPGPSIYASIHEERSAIFFKLVETLKLLPAALRQPITLFADCPEAAEAVLYITKVKPEMAESAATATLAVYCCTSLEQTMPPKSKGYFVCLLANHAQYHRTTAASIYRLCAQYEKVTLYNLVLRGNEGIAVLGANASQPWSGPTATDSIPLFFLTRLSEAFIILGQSGLETARLESSAVQEWRLKHYH